MSKQIIVNLVTINLIPFLNNIKPIIDFNTYQTLSQLIIYKSLVPLFIQLGNLISSKKKTSETKETKKKEPTLNSEGEQEDSEESTPPVG